MIHQPDPAYPDAYPEWPYVVRVNDQVHAHTQMARYEWLEHNLGDRNSSWCYPYDHMFRFTTESDAITFSLTWS